MKSFMFAALTAISLVAAPAAAQTISSSVDSNPTVGFVYGAGNNYLPANAEVLTTANDFGSRQSPPLAELAVRAHVPGQLAASTGGSGIYTFALGSNVSFDFSFFGTALTGANITVTNLLTGGDASFSAALLGTVQSNGALQGSQQLGFRFLNGGSLASENINFNNQVDSTYRIDLTGGGQTLTTFAQLGAGGVAAVPEPATWAMMLIGFGAMGVSMRRRRKLTNIAQLA